MAYSKYTDQERYEILNDTENFIKKHPELSRNQVLTLRRYYRKTGLKMEQELGPNQEPTGRLYKTWEVSAFNPKTEEWTTAVNHGYDYGSQQQLSDFISQADPIRINPSRRKPAKRDHNVIFAFSDSQIDYREIDGVLHPIHDERALNVVRLMCQDLRPDTIVNLGDTVDLSALSRFDKDSNHFDHSMQPAFNRVHRLYAELRSDNPLSRIVEVDSNHNTRLKKFMLKNASQLFGLRQAGHEEEYPVMSYPFLANLNAVGVEWVSGYGSAEFVYGEEYEAPPIVFKHGSLVGSNVANKEANANPYTHIVRGHTHRPEVAHRTMRNGHYLTYMIVGVTCSIIGDVPSVHSAVDDHNQVVRNQEQWQQSVAVITDYKDGTYQFDNIMIKDGKAKYNGKEYNGNE
jgi:hypothetical protein